MDRAALYWVLLTLGLIAGQTLWRAWQQWRGGRGDAEWALHARLREDWLEAVGRQPGSEILAVQTLRNSLMSATMSASTAVLGLMGSLSLALPGLRAEAGLWSPRTLLELGLLALLAASLVSAAMAVRLYHHAGFVLAMPVGSASRAQWQPLGGQYLRRAGLLYGWSVRHLLLCLPLLAALLLPAAGAALALLLGWLLRRL